MTLSVQIHYVNKVPRTDIHHSIKSVGGRNPDGKIWKLDLANAVAKALDATYRFYVSTGGKSVWVSVVKSASGHLYLKTDADSLNVNNLLSLPEFP
ncbi:DUF3892 domain-containing protein [Rhodoferax sp. TS-BS-61-7]|uniref:DUF3892 domain-containing protein n=1 Tax=Rhodoferax sp. TS-BS-61-7 TaxID=2094194 RepID=UPI000CF6DFE0|nr:DUF3892 domain-containing protein [Rhodoferax sp. TS-BS-61-7]